MRRQVLLILIFIIAYLNVHGQFFPGKKINILLNKIVKAKQFPPDDIKYHYQNFYLRFDTITKTLKQFDYKRNVRPFQTKDGLFSDYSKLVGKQFIVKKIYPKKPIISTDKGRKFVLELFNGKIGTVYYDYDANFYFDFELAIVSKISLPKDFYCDDIIAKKDKFTNEISYYSPMIAGKSFIKIEKNGKSDIYFSIYEIGNTLNVGKKGLILLLENGTKISKPDAKIDVDTVPENGYRYKAFIHLNSNDINLLKKYRITDDRLYIYDGTIDKMTGTLLKAYLNCLTK